MLLFASSEASPSATTLHFACLLLAFSVSDAAHEAHRCIYPSSSYCCPGRQPESSKLSPRAAVPARSPQDPNSLMVEHPSILILKNPSKPNFFLQQTVPIKVQHCENCTMSGNPTCLQFNLWLGAALELEHGEGRFRWEPLTPNPKP